MKKNELNHYSLISGSITDSDGSSASHAAARIILGTFPELVFSDIFGSEHPSLDIVDWKSLVSDE